MIHMLSRFDLKPGVDLRVFQSSYKAFCEQMQAKGLLVETGKIGRRVSDTPMDTDANLAPEYYSVMSFRDRQQLDAAYAYIEGLNAQDKVDHVAVSGAVLGPVFTCWRDLP